MLLCGVVFMNCRRAPQFDTEPFQAQPSPVSSLTLADPAEPGNRMLEGINETQRYPYSLNASNFNDARIGIPTVCEGEVDLTASAIKRIEEVVQVCERWARRKGEHWRGAFRVKIHIGKDGSVVKITESGAPELPKLLIPCLEFGCIRNSEDLPRFSPPRSGSAVLELPIVIRSRK